MPKYDSLMDISTILNEYSLDIQEGIEDAAIEVAKKGVSELKTTSPKRKTNGGQYARSWRVKTEKGRGYVNCTIHNKEYQLTHLLENGHITRNGTTRTRAIKHIEPVEKKCISEYERDVERVIKNGGNNA